MHVAKSTININVELKRRLEELVAENYAESFTEAVNTAIACYIKMIEREKYTKEMEDAARDEEYMKRTLSAQEAFANVDAEVIGEW